MIAGAFSMAAGEYVSMRAQTELFERELALERHEILRRPEGERRELVKIYENRGVDPEAARRLADEMMRTPELALETHAREELGINPNALGLARAGGGVVVRHLRPRRAAPAPPVVLRRRDRRHRGLGRHRRAWPRSAVGDRAGRFHRPAVVVLGRCASWRSRPRSPAAVTYGIGRAVGDLRRPLTRPAPSARRQARRATSPV